MVSNGCVALPQHHEVVDLRGEPETRRPPPSSESGSGGGYMSGRPDNRVEHPPASVASSSSSYMGDNRDTGQYLQALCSGGVRKGASSSSFPLHGRQSRYWLIKLCVVVGWGRRLVVLPPTWETIETLVSIYKLCVVVG